jgi:hypothetical protein
MLARTRIDEGSLKVFAKRLSDGQDVVEGVDYNVNYETGEVFRLNPWANEPGPYAFNYTWQTEVHPPVGPSPRWSTTGKILTSRATVRVIQMAAWTPDTFVDRRTLSNNFGALIEREGASSEAYRAFLAGIFQLYILGPVLERIESALNVVMNFPVVRDDGETFKGFDFSDSFVDRVLTIRPTTKQTVTYTFPKGAPIRTDLIVGQELLSFEPLTTAVTVTDYVQTPSWWHGGVIPKELFTPIDGQVPPVFRRVASPAYVEHVVGAVDAPQVGDPGLLVGTDEDGFDPNIAYPPLFPLPPAPPQPVFRHRMAFVLMDRYLKFHTFSVRFDAAALSALSGTDSAAFAQSLKDLNELVLSAKPSHTYVFTTPFTSFEDEVIVEELPIRFARQLGSRFYGPDKVLFTDGPPIVGGGVWNVGDYFKYEFLSGLIAFPVIAVPVTLTGTPTPPRAGRLVRVHVGGNVGGVDLVENVDYSVNYATREVTRLTVWASSSVTVTWTQLNIGNLSDAPIGVADMPLLVNGVDPAHITGAFDPFAAGWDGINTPLTAPRDLGMVERALIVYAHP